MAQAARRCRKGKQRRKDTSKRYYSKERTGCTKKAERQKRLLEYYNTLPRFC